MIASQRQNKLTSISVAKPSVSSSKICEAKIGSHYDDNQYNGNNENVRPYMNDNYNKQQVFNTPQRIFYGMNQRNGFHKHI